MRRELRHGRHLSSTFVGWFPWLRRDHESPRFVRPRLFSFLYPGLSLLPYALQSSEILLCLSLGFARLDLTGGCAIVWRSMFARPHHHGRSIAVSHVGPCINCDASLV